jgi:hypothetical protein
MKCAEAGGAERGGCGGSNSSSSSSSSVRIHSRRDGIPKAALTPPQVLNSASIAPYSRVHSASIPPQ